MVSNPIIISGKLESVSHNVTLELTCEFDFFRSSPRNFENAIQDLHEVLKTQFTGMPEYKEIVVSPAKAVTKQREVVGDR